MCAAVYPTRSSQALTLTALLGPQRQQKQRQLLGRLQDLLLGPKADEQTTCEVLDYFLRRLGSSQVASRVLAMKVSVAWCMRDLLLWRWVLGINSYAC